MSGPPESKPLRPLPQCTARLGAERVSLDGGESRMRWAIPESDRFNNTGGAIHGGYLCVFADALLGSSLSGMLSESQYMVTPDLSVQFLERVRPGQELVGHGRVVQRGTTMAFLEAEVHERESDALVLIAQGTGLVRERRDNGSGPVVPRDWTPPAWAPCGASLLADAPPWVRDLGVHFEAQGDGTAELLWPIASTEFCNYAGTIQGGYLCLVADAAMGFALVGGLEDARGMATTTLSIHLLRPAKPGMVLRVRGEVTRRGYRFGFMRSVITADDDPSRPIATANATGLIRR